MAHAEVLESMRSSAESNGMEGAFEITMKLARLAVYAATTIKMIKALATCNGKEGVWGTW